MAGKKEPIIKICVICNAEFVAKWAFKTCSDMCSGLLLKQHLKAASKRFKEKHSTEEYRIRQNGYQQNYRKRKKELLDKK